MSVQLVRFRTDPTQVPDVESAIADLFAAVADAAPSGIDYSATRVGESEFVLTLELDDGGENPLPAIPAAREFRERVAAFAGGPVPPQDALVLGRYRA